MKSIAILIASLAYLSNALGQHQSIMLSDAAGICEPSICVDPNNTDRIVAAVVLDRVFYSEDAGRTWKGQRVNSDYGVWGDPVIDVDEAGNFYFFHLSNPKVGHWIDRIVCQRSEDGGQTWNNGSFTGLNGDKQQDKHWSVIDHERGIIHLTWTEFDEYGSERDDCMSRIQYSYSQDRGDTWSAPTTISSIPGDCVDDDDTVEGAVPALGPDGELYVAWAGPSGLTFSRSLNDGLTWSREILIDPMPGGWTHKIPGLYRANGLPVTKVDCSGGPHNGRIYVNWADQRNGESDTDIWLAYSDNKGESWSGPHRVNQGDDEAHQFFTWMDIDQSNGLLYFVYYDRRDAPEDSPVMTEVYMALSIDGGTGFYEFPLETPGSGFVPKTAVFFGDYNNISAHEGVVRPIWTRLDDTKHSVWTSIVDVKNLGPDSFLLNPKFDLAKDSKVCLMAQGKAKKHRIWEKELAAGQHNLMEVIAAEDWAPGVYKVQVKKGKAIYWETEIKVDAAK